MGDQLKKILIAENDNTSFVYYREVLSPLCSRVIWAQDGKQCLELFKENPDISLIIMDIEMPIMNGYEASAAIKEISDVPIIVLTAYAMRSVKDRVDDIGCEEFLTKPIRANDLVTAALKYI